MIKVKLASFGVIGLVGVSSLAVAAGRENVEVVSLNVLFEVPWCTSSTGSNSETCVAFASLGNNIAITLDHCVTAEKRVDCTGTWQMETQTDGYPFASSISVIKSTDESGQSTYTLSANVGPVLNSREPTGGQIALNQDGTLTNSVTFNGPKLDISKSDGTLISYRPYLLINPRFPIPSHSLAK